MIEINEILKAPKNARLELKTTDAAKEFIRKAASISGLDMTSFIISSAFEKAEEVMEKHRRIEVSEQAYARALEILNEDTAPTPGLLNLMRGKHGDKSDSGL